MTNLLMFFEETATNTENQSFLTKNPWVMWVILGVVIVAMLVFSMIRRKKDKQAADQMYSNIVVGAVITTIGGIVGTITRIDEQNNTIFFETGEEGSSNKTTMQIVKNAVYSVRNKKDSAEVEEVTNEIK